MHEVKIEDYKLNIDNLDEAFDKVFGNEALYKVHGLEKTVISPWKNNERIIKFRTKVENIPMELRRFFCGKELKVTNRQIITEKTDTNINIRNKVRMHFIGAEFFHVKPFFSLVKRDQAIYLNMRIENSAIFPPPLNGICENFMAAKSKKELEFFIEALESEV